MLTVACVQVGNYCGRGGEYVERLFRGVAKNLSGEWRGVCLTDDPSCVPPGVEAIEPPELLDGWWNKLTLFRLLKGRVLYFDLDTVIVGSLDDVAAYSGRFACLEWGGKPASGIMAWDAEAARHLWTLWEAHWRPSLTGGDQEWVRIAQPSYEALNRIYPGQFRSFKADVLPTGKIAPDTRAVYFHGEPRPHECPEPWRSVLWG